MRNSHNGANLLLCGSSPFALHAFWGHRASLTGSHDLEAVDTDVQQVRQKARGRDSQRGPVPEASSRSGWPCRSDDAAAPACPAAGKREPSGGGSGTWSADPAAGRRNKERHVSGRLEQRHFKILPKLD